jgi:hypothetical protein
MIQSMEGMMDVKADTQFEMHARLLKGEDVERNIDTPIAGFYRIRSKDKRTEKTTFLPVSYRYIGDFEALECFIDGRRVDDLRAREQWPWASKNPISKETYDAVMNGNPWPDMDATVHEQLRGVGDNRGPTDPAEILKEQIEAARAGASAYAVIKDDETNTRAQTLRSRLIELSGQADKHRVAEKEPHLEASRSVDAKWQPLVKEAKTAADSIRSAMGVWETAKHQKQLAIEQAAQRTAIEAQEAARKLSAETGKPVEIPPAPPSPAPIAPTRIKGAAGRAASVATVTIVQSVSDWNQLFQFFRLREDVQALLIKSANAELKLGNQVPGIVTAQERIVK